MLSRSLICLFAVLAVFASGCGETTNTSTSAATSTGTSAPAKQSSHPVNQGTTSAEAQHARTAGQPTATTKTAQAKRHPLPAHPFAIPGIRGKTKPISEPKVPGQRFRYPKKLRRAFIAACEAAKGSPSTCECLIVKQEMRKVEKGQAVAEMLAIETVMVHGHESIEQVAQPEHSPEGVRRGLEQCLSAKK